MTAIFVLRHRMPYIFHRHSPHVIASAYCLSSWARQRCAVYWLANFVVSFQTIRRQLRFNKISLSCLL